MGEGKSTLEAALQSILYISLCAVLCNRALQFDLCALDLFDDCFSKACCCVHGVFALLHILLFVSLPRVSFWGVQLDVRVRCGLLLESLRGACTPRRPLLPQHADSSAPSCALHASAFAI